MGKTFVGAAPASPKKPSGKKNDDEESIVSGRDSVSDDDSDSDNDSSDSDSSDDDEETEEGNDNGYMDHCCICHNGGDLICCDGPGCGKFYHAECVRVDINTLPLEWICPTCVAKEQREKTAVEVGGNGIGYPVKTAATMAQALASATNAAISSGTNESKKAAGAKGSPFETLAKTKPTGNDVSKKAVSDAAVALTEYPNKSGGANKSKGIMPMMFDLTESCDEEEEKTSDLAGQVGSPSCVKPTARLETLVDLQAAASTNAKPKTIASDTEMAETSLTQQVASAKEPVSTSIPENRSKSTKIDNLDPTAASGRMNTKQKGGQATMSMKATTQRMNHSTNPNMKKCVEAWDAYHDGGGGLLLKAFWRNENYKIKYGISYKTFWDYSQMDKAQRTPLGSKVGPSSTRTDGVVLEGETCAEEAPAEGQMKAAVSEQNHNANESSAPDKSVNTSFSQPVGVTEKESQEEAHVQNKDNASSSIEKLGVTHQELIEKESFVQNDARTTTSADKATANTADAPTNCIDKSSQHATDATPSQSKSEAQSNVVVSAASTLKNSQPAPVKVSRPNTPQQPADAANFPPAITHRKLAKKKCTVSACRNYGGVCLEHGKKVIICDVPHCTRFRQVGKLCVEHGAKMKRCKREGCSKQIIRQGLCQKHFTQSQKVLTSESAPAGDNEKEPTTPDPLAHTYRTVIVPHAKERGKKTAAAVGDNDNAQGNPVKTTVTMKAEALASTLMEAPAEGRTKPGGSERKHTSNESSAPDKSINTSFSQPVGVTEKESQEQAPAQNKDNTPPSIEKLGGTHRELIQKETIVLNDDRTTTSADKATANTADAPTNLIDNSSQHATDASSSQNKDEAQSNVVVSAASTLKNSQSAPVKVSRPNTPQQSVDAANFPPAITHQKRSTKKCTVSTCRNYGAVCLEHGKTFRTCDVPHCIKSRQTGGLCVEHGAKMKRCKREGCYNQVVRQGLCQKHFTQSQKVLTSESAPAGNDAKESTTSDPLARTYRTVIVPQGVKPGELFHAVLDKGKVIGVNCPKGVSPGDKLIILEPGNYEPPIPPAKIAKKNAQKLLQGIDKQEQSFVVNAFWKKLWPALHLDGWTYQRQIHYDFGATTFYQPKANANMDKSQLVLNSHYFETIQDVMTFIAIVPSYNEMIVEIKLDIGKLKDVEVVLQKKSAEEPQQRRSEEVGKSRSDATVVVKQGTKKRKQDLALQKKRVEELQRRRNDEERKAKSTGDAAVVKTPVMKKRKEDITSTQRSKKKRKNCTSVLEKIFYEDAWKWLGSREYIGVGSEYQVRTLPRAGSHEAGERESHIQEKVLSDPTFSPSTITHPEWYDWAKDPTFAGKFDKSIMECKKEMHLLAKALDKPLGFCLFYYYHKYKIPKNADNYQCLKKMISELKEKENTDECASCKDGGHLLRCDTCTDSWTCHRCIRKQKNMLMLSPPQSRMNLNKYDSAYSYEESDSDSKLE